MEYPALVYKCPGPFAHNGGTHDYLAVNDAAERDQRIAEGWFKSMLEAIEGKTSASEQEEEDNSAPTRAELEAKAKELGIAFDGRTSDAKLLGKINDALNVG